MLQEVTPIDPERFGGLGEMTVAVPVTERFKQLCPSVVHLDGTARIQGVDAQRSPQLWRILKAFQDETGLPALINTSLNRHREPICRTLEDALVCASAAKLDFVLTGSTTLYYRHSRDSHNAEEY
jgi:carbamoyltransferase